MLYVDYSISLVTGKVANNFWGSLISYRLLVVYIVISYLLVTFSEKYTHFFSSLKSLFFLLMILLHQELQFFDCSKLSNELFEELGQIVQAPNFQTDLVCGVSQACESLCSWVRALYQYACVKRHMAPQEAIKKHLNNCMAKIHAQLQVAWLEEEAARDRLEDVEKQHQFVKNYLKELSARLHKVEIQEKEAAVTIKQVNYYIEKWNMAKMVSKSY